MAEGSKVRLVRCPNCDNLLPELPEYSVYQCGGCGTILRAKKKDQRSDILYKNSDEESGFVGSEKSDIVAEKPNENVNFGSETETDDNSGTESNWRRKERPFVEKKTNFGNNADFRRAEKNEILVRDDLGLSDEFEDLRLKDRYNRYTGINNANVNQPKKVVASLRTRPRMDLSGAERGPNFPYHEAGPSNYDQFSFHGHARANVPNEVEKLEQERAELIRKLDELKDQLTRPYHVADIPKEREPMDRNFSHAYGNPVISPNAPYFNQVSNIYPPRTHNLNYIPEYEDPFQPGMTRMPHHRPPLHQHHPQVSPREFYPHRSFDPNPDPFNALYPHENFNRATPRVPPYKSSGPVDHISNFYRHDEPTFDKPQQGYYPHSDSEGYGQPRKTVLATHQIRRRCRQIAGGAPFITCQNCFVVLKLPTKKLRVTRSYKQKLRCGSCSALILLNVENNKKIVATIVTEVLSESVVDSDSSIANCDKSVFSEDFKQPSFNFHSAVTDHSSLVEENERVNLDGPEKRKVYSSSPSISSREEESIPSAISREDDFPIKNVPSSPVPPRSPMRQKPDPGPAVVKDEQGNTSKRTESEDGDDENGFGRINYRNDLVRDLAEPTELDIPFEDYQHNMSVDFAEMSKEEYQLRLNQGNSDSFLVGFIKKSIRDLSKSSHSVAERPKVYINGHPLADRLVKKAEKYAGTIRPGDYWYDYKGGFWGVMGQPCLGIIPPYIEEFNFPMPTNCGAGNTSVYVNGRELNQRDLDLLASRGLPTTRNKFYIVEISGKVVDEDTGKELDNLGKLAPTVEKVNHGFGMKVPRVVT